MTGEPFDIPVTPEAMHWQRVKALFHAVHDLPPEAQAARLQGDDEDDTVRDEVRRLLHAARDVGTRFETPALAALDDEGRSAHDRTDRDRAWERSDDAPSLVGRRLGPYHVVRRIGQGGMGAVYEAVRADAAYEQRVAIKSLWRGTDSATLLQRFRSERQILAALQHPHIARLLDGGTTAEGTPWLALEFVDGQPIDAFCDAARLGLTARLDLFRQVCAAVHAAHRQFVVHRDLKPSNVFVDQRGQVKLLDFGVAKLLDPTGDHGTLTEAGLAPYTAAYAAPEQLTGAGISVATDVYALGALLVDLLTGAPPLDVRDVYGAALVQRITEEVPLPPSALVRRLPPGRGEVVASARGFASAERLARALSGELDAIAGMALRKEPDRRYASAEALSDDVHRWLRRDRVLARPDTLGYRLRATVRRRPAMATGVGVSLAASLLAGGMWWQQTQAQRREIARTERVAQFMAGLVAGPDMASGDPLVRIGPRGTIAELLDGAIARVPREFADDPRSRARLYTAIGANLIAQERFTRAEALLDSAVQLTRRTDGPRSDVFAAAALELARARFARGGPAAAQRALDEAEQAVADRPKAPVSLVAGITFTRGVVLRAEGQVRAADSIARQVLALDSTGGRRVDMLTVRAQLLRAYTESWLLRDPRVYVRRCRHAAALTEQLQAQLSAERLASALCEVDGLLTLGQVEAADSLLRHTTAWYTLAYGTQTLNMAALLAQSASIAASRGDMAALRRDMLRAQALLEATDEAPAESVASVAAVLVELHRGDGQLDEALRLARWARDRAVPQRVAVASVYALHTLARVHLARGEHADADATLLRGLAAFPASGDLDSMRPQLLRTRLAIATASGNQRLADSIRIQLPAPRAPVPDCTPGGRWTGCAIGDGPPIR